MYKVLLLLLLSGCANYQPRHPVHYTWTMRPTSPQAYNGTIYMDYNWLSNKKPYLSMVLEHEDLHLDGLKHCDKWSCLMYKSFEVWPIPVNIKKLCNDCKAIIDAK